MIKDWVMIASHRQNRPQMPKDWCPFCPGSGKVPDSYDVYKYDNDFPALSQNPPEPDDVATDFYKVKPSHGKCEVILFSPEHTGNIRDLSDEHMNKLVNLWCERFEAMREDEKIKYVFIFENRGDVVGVTMPHPHGQMYGYSVLPKKMELELDAGLEHYNENNCECIFCRMNKEETSFKERVICENEDFIAYIPFFADYAYGVYIVSKKHKQYITDFTDSEKMNLGIIMRNVVGMYDNIFDFNFPYMMCMHNAPVNMEDEKYKDFDKYTHFHIEYYPPLRDSNKQQFQASSETGVWAHCNPTAPEAKAAEMCEALARYLAKINK
jgi:UDPglucose--hexose-1-phosphate uridylyltransferase